MRVRETTSRRRTVRLAGLHRVSYKLLTTSGQQPKPFTLPPFGVQRTSLFLCRPHKQRLLHHLCLGNHTSGRLRLPMVHPATWNFDVSHRLPLAERLVDMNTKVESPEVFGTDKSQRSRTQTHLIEIVYVRNGLMYQHSISPCVKPPFGPVHGRSGRSFRQSRSPVSYPT
jgi:hypothetical protein